MHQDFRFFITNPNLTELPRTLVKWLSAVNCGPHTRTQNEKTCTLSFMEGVDDTRLQVYDLFYRLLRQEVKFLMQEECLTSSGERIGLNVYTLVVESMTSIDYSALDGRSIFLWDATCSVKGFTPLGANAPALGEQPEQPPAPTPAAAPTSQNSDNTPEQ